MREHGVSAKRITASLSSAQRLDERARRGDLLAGGLRMLPLSSSAITIDTGATASWKVSMFCATPSSTTSGRRATRQSAGSAPVTVNSMVGRTGGGLGAK